MKTIIGFEKAKKVLDRRAPKNMEYKQEPVVRKIIENVRKRGDAALFEYTEKFDGVKLNTLEVTAQQKKAAYKKIDKKLEEALQLAADRIRAFHEMQAERALHSYTHGKTGWIARPLERVGVYAPGGTASYPSTVLMTAIPAQVAGVKEIILATPADKTGRISPAVLVAANMAGIQRIFSVGGAQAIAAMAYGTETIPRVDKICGPGNLFVMLAKKQVFGTVAIDALQGPSEVMIIADETAKPATCAADMLAQAEHDTLSQSTLVTTSDKVAMAVAAEVDKQLAVLPRKAIAGESIKEKGIIAVVDNIDEAIEIANLYAPEHLCLVFKDAGKYVDNINNAGCIFVGENSGEVLGDYDAGPSHALPTGGTARFSSPLNITDFIKYMNVVAIQDKALSRELWSAAAVIARIEGLEGHARAADKRLE